jgi:DNA modification methylase
VIELNTIYNESCLDTLSRMPDEFIDCCITSPPYYGLRDYGVADQIGLEETPEQYVQKLVEVFREVRRVLKSDGTLWLNLGDSFYSSPSGQNGMNNTLGGGLPCGGKGTTTGRIKRQVHDILKPKDIIGIPWRVAFVLQDYGWYLRQDIIWSKPNPMPESVTDRCTKAHEYIFLLTKSARYYYDAEAIKEPFADSTLNDSRLQDESYDVGRPERGYPGGNSRGAGLLVPKAYRGSSFTSGKTGATHDNIGQGKRKEIFMRNKRSVWTITTKPYKGAHFATFPEDIPATCIKTTRPDAIVYDPFMGAGTTALVAAKLGRRYIGSELNADYCRMAEKRLTDQLGMFKNAI